MVDKCHQRLSEVGQSSEEAVHSTLLVLQMFETALSKQDEFLSILRLSHTHSLNATPRDNFLLTLNPHTKKADFFVTIARYMALSNHSPELALSATRVLYLSSSSMYAAKEMGSNLVMDADVSAEILHGFVEHLEWDEPGLESLPQADSGRRARIGPG